MRTATAWETIRCDRADALTQAVAESRAVVLISSGFKAGAKTLPPSLPQRQLSTDSIALIEESVRLLRRDGLLFVFGLPSELPEWARQLSQMRNHSFEMVFKYWIALDMDDAPRGGGLKPTHMGLLMFSKSRAGKQSAFHMNNRTVRVPHSFCAACGLSVKDWGGKKHLMNPHGTALSDVWRDLPHVVMREAAAPAFVLDRIHALTVREDGGHLHVVQTTPGITAESAAIATLRAGDSSSAPEAVPGIKHDQVLLTDCVSFLKLVETRHPEGIFDLAFADPPYNLKKSYDRYADALAEQHYLEWCNTWLGGMARTLKPGGSLFVLNLPKWAVHHAACLNSCLEFRNWIVWNALSDPRGKLMPAHYALLYYTKPGAPPVFNCAALNGSGLGYCLPAMNADGPTAIHQTEFVLPPDSPKYCLRAACLKQRKARGDDEKTELTDIWSDIHRIKHRRDRDAHPCQLPDKLMERIIKLTTHRGGLVFDPFCGAGTTAIAATKLGRHFVVTDLDENYVRITNEKIAAMKQNASLFGSFVVPRASVVKPRRPAAKREIELYLQGLARKLGRVPEENDVTRDRPEVLGQIDLLYAIRSAAFKRCKVVLAE